MQVLFKDSCLVIWLHVVIIMCRRSANCGALSQITVATKGTITVHGGTGMVDQIQRVSTENKRKNHQTQPRCQLCRLHPQHKLRQQQLPPLRYARLVLLMTSHKQFHLFLVEQHAR